MKAVITALAFAALAAACGPGALKPDAISHVHGLGLDPRHPQLLYVATHFGLYVREGTSWSRRSRDTDDHMGFTLSPAGMWRSGHPSTGGSLGVQRSTDGGRTWTTLNSVLNPAVDFHAMTSTRSGPPSLYGWDSGGRGTFRSSDGGTTWKKLSAHGLPERIGALAASGSTTVYATTDQGLYRSSDGGNTWRRRSADLQFALASGGKPGVLFASEARGGGIVRSVDGGKKWKKTGSDLDASTIVALVASADGRIVVAADDRAEISMSKDGGETWRSIPMP